MVIGAHGEYEISGGNNGNYMYGTQHNDVIAGYESSSTAQTAGDDVMYGFAGDDEFAGGQGTDRIYGGDGSDTSNYAHSQAGINADLKIVGTNEYGSYAEVSDGFGTYDQLYSIENIVGSVYDDTIKGDDNANAFVGLGGNDTIYGEGGADIIDGGDGQDSLEGGNGADTIKGGDRPDYLDGGEGDDSLHGGAFKDTLIGGKDNDTLNGSWGRDLLKGGMGTDVLYGDHSHDTIYGEMGTDDLYGGEGNDILNGGKGYDTMTGGAGADTFILGGNSQKDIITDFNSDEGDTIDIDKSIYGFSSVSDLSFDGITGELKVSATGATIVTLENPVNFTFDDIYLDGVQNTDPLVVTGIIEEGTNGNDYLEGIHTPDILNGGEGNDTLIGYGGEDILTPGYGVDILTGGADADTFVFDVNERPTSRTANDNSTDFITDFSTGEDVIHIDKSAFGTHTDNITRRSLEFDYDSSSQSGVLSIGYLIGNYALETKIVTIENLASASEFNMGTDVQLV
ncbi:calcium-binding protein [Dapis sp. BLCC M229]